MDKMAELQQTQAENAQRASSIFSSVDLRDKGMVSWQDFTSYVVNSFQYTEIERVDGIANYVPTHRINTSYDKEIDRIFKIDDIGEHGSLVITEKGSKSFKIATPDSFSELHTMRPSKWTEIKGHQGDILAVDHLSEFGYIVTSSTDCTINFWETDNYKLCQRLPVPVPQLTMEWFPTTSTSRPQPRQGSGTGGHTQPNAAGVLFTAGMMDPKTQKVRPDRASEASAKKSQRCPTTDANNRRRANNPELARGASNRRRANTELARGASNRRRANTELARGASNRRRANYTELARGANNFLFLRSLRSPARFAGVLASLACSLRWLTPRVRR
jgi:hypothetical protein